MQNKTKITQNIYWQWVFRIIKWAVPFFIALVLYKKFYRNSSFSFTHFESQLQLLDWHWYAALAFFSCLNWSIETYKWKFLLRKLELVDFRTALKSVLCGMAVSQLLPYRTGEYLGRLAYISDAHKLSAGILSVAGSFSQLLITLIVGIPAFMILRPAHTDFVNLSLIASSLILFLLILFYLSRSALFNKVKLFGTLKLALGLLNRKDIGILMLMSLCRYAAFVIPYALIAQAYDLPANTTIYNGITAVACIYFLQTISPNFILTDLVIRLSVPALVFSGSMATGMEYIPGMFIYLFNIAIPMCMGALILLLARIRR